MAGITSCASQRLKRFRPLLRERNLRGDRRRVPRPMLSVLNSPPGVSLIVTPFSSSSRSATAIYADFVRPKQRHTIVGNEQGSPFFSNNGGIDLPQMQFRDLGFSYFMPPVLDWRHDDRIEGFQRFRAGAAKLGQKSVHQMPQGRCDLACQFHRLRRGAVNRTGKCADLHEAKRRFRRCIRCDEGALIVGHGFSPN